MSAVFSLGSLLLGIAAWAIPMIAVKLHRKGRPFASFSIYSFTLCTIALMLQLFEIRHRAAIEDFSAIMDTIGTVSVAALLLVIGTVALNAVGFAFYRMEQENGLESCTK